VARPGIVHRLDKGTSGVMVVAKDDLAQHSLSEQFKSHEVEKKYFAFVWGNLRHLSGTIDMPLGRSMGDRKRISSKSKHTRHAITQYHVLQNWEGVSLLELTPLTGRTHQIRVHLAEMGHPIIGDPTYGKGLRRISILSKRLQEMLSSSPFQFLHASFLSFRHPRTGKRVNFSAPMRNEMREFQKGLIKNENKSSKKGMSRIDYQEKRKK
jgi:23S rRNA pseudouridine1911/1915/1917 synthase